jgi:hypothetical protein
MFFCSDDDGKKMKMAGNRIILWFEITISVFQNGQLIRHVSHIELSAIIYRSHMLFHFIMESVINIDLFRLFFVRDIRECD